MSRLDVSFDWLDEQKPQEILPALAVTSAKQEPVTTLATDQADDEPTGDANTDISIQVGEEHQGSFEHRTDVDAFGINLQAGQLYRILITGVYRPFIRTIFDDSGNEFAPGPASSGLLQGVRYVEYYHTPPADGEYFVPIHANICQAFGSRRDPRPHRGALASLLCGSSHATGCSWTPQ